VLGVRSRVGFRLDVDQSSIRVERIGALSLFVSWRFKWQRWENEVQPLVFEAVRYRGFEPIVGDVGGVRGGYSDAENLSGYFDVPKEVIERIRRSAAFLQVIPDIDSRTPAQLRWMQFELGLAVGAGIPVAICVDVWRRSVEKWHGLGLVPAWKLWKFDGHSEANRIRVDIGEAVDWLAQEVRERSQK